MVASDRYCFYLFVPAEDLWKCDQGFTVQVSVWEKAWQKADTLSGEVTIPLASERGKISDVQVKTNAKKEHVALVDFEYEVMPELHVFLS